MTSLSQAAIAVLNTADAHDKCRLTHQTASQWQAGMLAHPAGEMPVPDRPARPDRPPLLAPRDMPRRTYAGAKGRISLLHALAHIELNAIDLAWDLIARFADPATPKALVDDWVQVALDEARHFELLDGLLNDLGAAYGDLPAHDGLWQAAEKTAHDPLARLAIVPMTLEARGLDTTPVTMEKLARNGDHITPPVLEVIYHDEIRHVAAGLRWFRHLLGTDQDSGPSRYAQLIGTYFPGGLKAPFNHGARLQAGLSKEWYDPLAA